MSELAEKFQKLFFEKTQAHHDADLVCQIGAKILESNPSAIETLSATMVDAMVDGLKDRFGDEAASSVQSIPGGPVAFHVDRNYEIFVYGLATHNIVMHHSIFDGLLSELLEWIKDVNPALFDGAIQTKQVRFQDLSNKNIEDLRAPLVSKFVKDKSRESIAQKVSAITAAVTGSLPTLNQDYSYDELRMSEIDSRRHEIIHNTSKRVNIDDRKSVSDYMRSSSIAFITYVFNKLHEGQDQDG